MVKAGEKLEEKLECPACGGAANMTVTKNKTIFAYCKNIVDEATNEKCGYRGFLGRTKSREIIRQINETRQQEQDEHVQPEQENPEYTASTEGSGGEPAEGTSEGNGEPEPLAPTDGVTPKDPRKVGVGLLGSILGGGTAFD